MCRPCHVKQVKVGRGYGRVSRRLLREHLLKICDAAGVRFSCAEVADIQVRRGAGRQPGGGRDAAAGQRWQCVMSAACGM